MGKAKLTYEELQTSVTEVKAILNSRPLTYISASDLDEPLTPHLILGRRLLSLPDHLCEADSDLDYNTTSRVFLNKRKRYLQTVLEQFWRRWKEYLLELREVHRYHKGKLGAKQIAIGDVVIVHEDTQRRMWRIGIVEETLVSKDKEIRGAVVRVKAGKGASSFSRRPIQWLYPLEVQHESPLQETTDSSTGVTEQSNRQQKGTSKKRDYSNEENVPTTNTLEYSFNQDSIDLPEWTLTSESQIDTNSPETSVSSHPRHRAATEARDRIVARLLDS